MKTSKLYTKLKEKFNVATDAELEKLSGIWQSTLSNWKKDGKELSEEQIANLVYKSAIQGGRNAKAEPSIDTSVLYEKLKEKFNVESDVELTERSGIWQSTLSNWKKNDKGLTEGQIANLIYKSVVQGEKNVRNEPAIDKSELLEELKNKFEVNTDVELAKRSGIWQSILSNWKNCDKGLSEAQIANLLYNSNKKIMKDCLNNAIRPVAEFIKIDPGESVEKKLWDVFDKNASKKHSELRNKISNSIGVYFFYNSEGKVIYTGKTKNNLWLEINSSYNLDRLKHKAYFSDQNDKDDMVYHPEDNPIEISNTSVSLRDVAQYFSAYEVSYHMIDNLEAMLTRALANNMINIKKEKFKYPK